MKRVLVTGAAGFLGLHLSRFLQQQGYSLILCDNLERTGEDLEFQNLCQQKDVTFFKLDLTDPNALRRLEGPFEAVYHLAAINGTRFFYQQPERVLKVNLLSLIHLLDWLVAQGLKKFLFASTPEVYAGTILLHRQPLPTPENVPLCIPDVDNPRFSYAASKIAGELLTLHYARRHRFSSCIVRYHNIYGPRMGMEHVIPHFIQRALRRENPFKIYGARHQRTFCYVEDACEATLRLMEKDYLANEVVHIGNPQEEIEMVELAKKICALADFEPQFKMEAAPEGSVPRRLPDITKLQQALGFAPKIDLATGLKKTFDWYACHAKKE